MGAQIALSLALGGVSVALWGRGSESLSSARKRIDANLRFVFEAGIAPAASYDEISGRIFTTEDMAKAVQGAGFVIEAVVEKLDIKQKVLSATHFWLGSVFQTRGDLDQGLRHFQTHLAIASQMSLATTAGPNVSWQIERAQGHANVGNVLEQQGKLEEALRQYETSIAAKEEALASKPSDLDLLMDLSENMTGKTICVLSDSCAAPVVSGIKKFRGEFEAYLAGKREPVMA